eukprot:scaffold178110_cov41-Tisochrysis_lutea.AAC.4
MPKHLTCCDSLSPMLAQPHEYTRLHEMTLRLASEITRTVEDADLISLRQWWMSSQKWAAPTCRRARCC